MSSTQSFKHFTDQYILDIVIPWLGSRHDEVGAETTPPSPFASITQGKGHDERRDARTSAHSLTSKPSVPLVAMRGAAILRGRPLLAVIGRGLSYRYVYLFNLNFFHLNTIIEMPAHGFWRH